MKQDRKFDSHIAEHAHDVKIAKLRLGLFIIGGIFLFVVIVAAFAVSLAGDVRQNFPERTAEIAVNGTAPVEDHAEFFGIPDEPTEGVGRAAKTFTVTRAASGVSADRLDYTDGVIWGWDGRYCELWEMDLFARIMYLEFWGTSPECCEAGVDSVLRMLESGYFGDSLGAVLSARCETGALVYSTYAYVWDWTYDPDGLAEMYALCMDRWTNGPVWVAPFFQLYRYPSWAVPCYQLDGVFFSTSPWLMGGAK